VTDEERAVWSTAYINNLPDSAFLYIESGGSKDDQGKTTPRELRHFPVHDDTGKLDMPHLRNAMSRIPQSDLPQAVKDRVMAKAQRLMDSANRSELPEAFEQRGTDLWPDEDMELRATGDGLSFEGYALKWDRWSVPIPGPSGKDFRERFAPGSMDRTLARNPDVVLSYQHLLTTLPLGRTRAGTFQIESDSTGLITRATLPDNELGRPVRDSIRRKDITGMSIRFRVASKAGEKWNADYTQREVLEAQLGPEISLVTFPAYPDTTATVRHLAEAAELPVDDLAVAFDTLRDPEAKLTRDQQHLLMEAVNAKVDEPYVSPKIVAMQEQLSLLR